MVGVFFFVSALALFALLRDARHPAVVFSATWGANAVAISAAGLLGFFQIGIEAAFIYVLGVTSFVVGSLLSRSSGFVVRNNFDYELDFVKIAKFCFLLHIIVLPLAWMEIKQFSNGLDELTAIAYRIRVATVSGEEKAGFVVGNYLTSALFFVPVLFVGLLRNKVGGWLFFVNVIPWILMSVFMSGRSGVVTLLLVLIYIYAVIGEKISFRSIFLFLIAVSFVLILGNLLVGKIEAGIDDGFSNVLIQSIEGFFDYALQGPILFSRYVDWPESINPTWDALVFFCQVLGKFNMCVVPPLHQDFMAYGIDGREGNVYSIFLSIYPAYGGFGVVLILGFYGFWSAFHHNRRYVSLFDLLMGGLLFSACVLSAFSDTFGTNVYLFIKIFLFSIVASYAFKKT